MTPTTTSLHIERADCARAIKKDGPTETRAGGSSLPMHGAKELIGLATIFTRLRFSDCLPHLVQPLPAFSQAVGCDVRALLGKSLPAKSTKFISVLGMLNHLSMRGALRNCRDVVLSSSGNTAMAVAEVVRGTGVTLHAVVDPRTAPGKLEELSRLNARVVMVDQPHSERGWLGSRLDRVEQLVRSIPGAVDIDQYGNAGALAAHYEFTGNFLWQALAGRIDIAVAPIGTGGTSGGTFYRLRELNPAIITVAVDCEGSAVLGGVPGPHLLTGIGAQFACANVLRAYGAMAGLASRIIGDAEAIREAHWLLDHDGISVGGSSGAALAAVRSIARAVSGKRIVVILPDGGEDYQKTIFSASWLASHGVMMNHNSQEGGVTNV